MINSINTNIAAYYAQANIGKASSEASSSVARLSSGNRIVQASNDVAALSIGTGLRTAVSALRTALTNASQGTSLLQVADGALSQVTEILQRQRAIAFQAGSGTLRDSDRVFLNTEFQNLSQEVDRLTASTNFNGVKLLNGGLSTAASMTAGTDNATSAASRISFSANISTGENIIINGVNFKAGSSSSGTTFQVGSTLSETLNNLADHLNSLKDSATYNNTIGKASYSVEGSSLVLKARAGGAAGNSFTVTDTSTTSAHTIAVAGAVFVEGSSVVTITDTAHGYSTGDVITIGNGTLIDSNGGSGGIANNNLYGKYTVTVTDANTYTIDTGTAAGRTLGNNPITTGADVATGQTIDITLTVGTNHGYIVGQTFTLSGASAVDNISASLFNTTQTITAISEASGTITFQVIADGNPSGATTGGGAAVIFTPLTNSSTLKVKAASATSNGQAELSGGAVGSYFNLFSTTTGLTTTSTVIADASSTSAPFAVDDSLTMQVNGVTKTLHTFVTGDTMQTVVDGINNNSTSTGVTATLIRSSGTYNIRLNYSGTASNVIIDGGANYNSDTSASGQTLGGVNLSSATAGTAGATAGASDRYSLYYTSYFDAFQNATSGTAPITVANLTTTVTAATPSATTAPFRIGDSLTVKLNGVTNVLHTFTNSDNLTEILTSINAKTAQTGIFAAVTGTGGAYGLRLYVSSGAPATDVFTVDAGAGVLNIAAFAQNRSSILTTTSAALNRSTVASLAGGADDGLAQAGVSITGSVGDNILAGFGSPISQSKAEVSVILTQNAVAADTITVGGRSFVFTTNTSRGANEILIGDTLQETIDNAVSTINAYYNGGHAVADEAYQMGQMDVTRNGNSIVFKSKSLANAYALDGSTAANIAQSITGASVTNSGNLSNASTTYGIDTTGVTNAAFLGTISGFTATYKDTIDTVDLSIKVGDFTYTAKNVDMTVSSNTRIRLYSDDVGGKNGGYFDIQLDAGNTLSFNSQAGADAIATRLDSAFSSVNFNQKRVVSSYTGGGSIIVSNAVIGSLTGTKLSAQLEDFDTVKLTNVSIVAPSGSNTDASITFTINGVEYSTASGLTGILGANQTYRLTSSEDPNQFIEFTTGESAIDLSSAENAAAAETALRDALGFDSGNASLSFQIGTTADDTLSVSIGDARTASIFDGEELDVLTQASASRAAQVLDEALQRVTGIRADVGALQSRFNFASSNIQIAIQNQDDARSTLLDTDITVESTAYATAQVKLQAGISVLAQANQQLQALLKLVG